MAQTTENQALEPFYLSRLSCWPSVQHPLRKTSIVQLATAPYNVEVKRVVPIRYFVTNQYEYQL